MRRLLPLALLVLALLAGYNLTLLVRGYDDPRWGGFDLHAYWYYGHFVWQGENPYRAFSQQADLTLPIHYLDGPVVATPPVRQPDLGDVPANTAPMLLLISPLSRLSWPVARSVWLVVTLAAVAATPTLLLRLAPPQRPLPPAHRWLLALAYWSLLGVSAGGRFGQTTALVFVALLGALLLRHHRPLLAGLLLGLALSKYSIALPVALFLLWDRRWKVLITGAGVQGVGLIVVSLLGGTPWQTLQAYAWLAAYHAPREGIHLAGVLSLVDASPLVATVLAPLLFSAPVALWVWRYRARLGPEPLAWLAILAPWSLLAVYHLNYDMVLIGLPLVWLLALGQRPLSAGPSEPPPTTVALLFAGTILALSPLPTILVARLPSPFDAVISIGAQTGWLLLLLAAVLWLAARPAHQRSF